MGETMRRRHAGLDALRILAAFLVVMIHVSGSFRELVSSGTISSSFPLVFLMTMADCGVSVFFIISGSFMIADDRNASFRRFYAGTAKKLVIPTLIFSLYYLVYSLITPLIKHDLDGVIHVLKETVMGRPFYHMWYMYAIICICLFIPAIVRLRLMAGDRTFAAIAAVLFVMSTLSDMTSSHMIQYDPGSAYRYAGLLFAGYLVKRMIDRRAAHSGDSGDAGTPPDCGKGDLIRGLLFIACWILTVAAAAFISMEHGAATAVYLLGVLSPILLFAAFCHFGSFPDCSALAGRCFLVYLLHAGVRDVVSRLSDKFMGRDALLLILPPAVSLLAVTLLFFLISLVLALVYERLADAAERKLHIRSRIYSAIKALFVVVFGL